MNARERKALWDWVLDHATHFKAMPMEFATFKDGEEDKVWGFDEYIQYLTKEQHAELDRLIS